MDNTRCCKTSSQHKTGGQHKTCSPHEAHSKRKPGQNHAEEGLCANSPTHLKTQGNLRQSALFSQPFLRQPNAVGSASLDTASAWDGLVFKIAANSSSETRMSFSASTTSSVCAAAVSSVNE